MGQFTGFANLTNKHAGGTKLCIPFNFSLWSLVTLSLTNSLVHWPDQCAPRPSGPLKRKIIRSRPRPGGGPRRWKVTDNKLKENQKPYWEQEITSGFCSGKPASCPRLPATTNVPTQSCSHAPSLNPPASSQHSPWTLTACSLL